jgi:hypothetical protein
MPDGTNITDIELGDTYKDTITGFKGKVVGRGDYLTGCAQALLTALVNGEVNSYWFDYPRLEKVEADRPALAEETSVRRAGGPGAMSAAQAAPRPA